MKILKVYFYIVQLLFYKTLEPCSMKKIKPMNTLKRIEIVKTREKKNKQALNFKF